MVVSLLYGSGMRLMECLRLRVKDVNLLGNRIDVWDDGHQAHPGAVVIGAYRSHFSIEGSGPRRV